jgi:UDPglucose 6-dehydrogenase
MRVGFIGLGKLGLPTALAIEDKGHEVIGCDPLSEVAEILRTRQMRFQEEAAQELLLRTHIRLCSCKEVIRFAELLFVTIQTPHAPQFEGVTRLPDERRDFDYTFLKAGMREVANEIEGLNEDRIVIVVSTVLPGTIRREIKPLLGPHAHLCYNPFFIAMGTVIPDFLRPEFVLFGVEDKEAANRAEAFYRTIHDAPFYRTSLENAEMIKVLYNTFISTKIAFANTAMELCHRMPGTDVDAVMTALFMGRDRLISTRYLSGGMGDGGGCHPRDNIALSHLAQRLGMSFDWFGNIMEQRERQTDWLIDLIEQHAGDLPICILGRAFKPACSIETGSPALLLGTLLEERGHLVRRYDPYCDGSEQAPIDRPYCYFIGTRHPEFATFPFAPGSVVLDPWRYVEGRPGVTLIPIGRQPLSPHDEQTTT